MKKFCTAAIFFIFTLNYISPMEWPVANGVVSKNFGYNDDGLPILGVNFRASGSVNAADDGDLLFYGDVSGDASGLPPVLGNWLALDHGGGIIGIYSRMAPETTDIPDSTEKSAAIGQSGISGWSQEKGVYFSLYDRKERRWINPAIIISPLPDPRAPQILSVKLRDEDGKLIDLGQAKTLSQGTYTIQVEAAQIFQGTSRNPLSPFRIICSVNGTEIGRLNFETYSARDGVLMVNRNGLVPVKQIFSPYPAFELGKTEFTRGQATMEVIAQDAAGNSRNVVYRLTVE